MMSASARRASAIAAAALFVFGLPLAQGALNFSESVENENVRVSVSESGISLFDKKSAKTFDQLPCAYKISGISKCGGTISFDIAAEIPLKASVGLVGRGFDLRICGSGKVEKDIKFPPAWKMKGGDKGIYPVGTGLALPAEMKCPTRKNPPAIRGAAWSMALAALERSGTFLITGIENPYDALVSNDMVGGLNHTSIQWQPQKGDFAYARSLRIFVDDSLPSAVARYRLWRESQGLVKTLRQKAVDVPNIDRLVGSANFWIWDENFYNRMYSKPENPDAPKRDVRKIAGEMLSLGISHVLWQNITGESAEDCRYLNELGFLVGKYDIYRDVLPADIADKIIPARVEMSRRRTKYWPDAVAVDKNGKFYNAWKVHGKDGKMYWQHAVCDVCAVQMTKDIVSADLKNVGYTARLIDVQAGTPPRECFSPFHPTTRRESSAAIRSQGEFMHSIGQVLGVECGHEFYAATYDYAEGLLSPELARSPQSGRSQTRVLRFDDMPEHTLGIMLNPAYRIPLWELAYHDCVVQYWYWGDTPANCPELMDRFDAFNMLYGYPPIYSLDVSNWEKLKGKIAASYAKIAPLAQRVGFAKMTNFEYLSADKFVQKSTFDNGVYVIVNFGEKPFTTDDGRVVEPLRPLVDGL